MQRPEVRIIDQQQETVNVDANVSQSDAEYLLYKYGFKKEAPVAPQPEPPQNNLSFEDMVRQQELQQRRIEEERNRRSNAPQPVSFNGRNVAYSETKYSDMEVGSNVLGIKIQIVTDMKI